MIVSAEALSPAQRSAIEQILGRQIREPPPVSLAERQVASEKLRRFLEGDRPRAGVSDEECEAALLEALRSERPAYTQIP
jgi:hypothetical protein